MRGPLRMLVKQDEVSMWKQIFFQYKEEVGDHDIPTRSQCHVFSEDPGIHFGIQEQSIMDLFEIESVDMDIDDSTARDFSLLSKQGELFFFRAADHDMALLWFDFLGTKLDMVIPASRIRDRNSSTSRSKISRKGSSFSRLSTKHITQLSRDGSLSSYSGDDTGDSFRRIRASFSEYVIRLVKLHTTSYANLNDEVDVSEIDDSTIVKIIKSPKYKRGSSFFKNVLSDKEIDNIAHEMKQLHCGLPDLQTMSFDFKDYNNIFKASDLIEWFWDKKYIASNSEGSILAQELLIRHHIFPFPPKESNDQPEFKKEFALYYFVSHSRRIKEFMESEHFEFPEVWINRMITQGPEHCKKLRVNGKAYENAFQGSTLLSWLQNFPEFGVGDNAERFCQFLAEEDFIITLNSKRAEFSSRVFRVVQSKGNTKEESATRIAVASPELLHLLYLLSDESHILVYLLRSYYLHSSASSHPSEAPEVFLDSDNHEQDLDLGIALVKLLFDYTPSFWEEAERLLCGRSAIVKALLIDLRWLYVTRRQHHECAVANDLLSQESCSYCTRTEQDFNEWLIENFRSKTCWSLETRDALVSLLIQRNWTMVKGTVFSQDIIRPQLLKGFLKALQYAPSDVVSAALLDLTTLLLTNRRNGIRIGKIDNWRAMFIPFICYNYGNELAHPLSCVVLVTYVLMSTPTEFCETMDSLIREIQIYPGLEPFSIKSRERVFKFLNHVIRHTIADMITRSNKLSPDDPGWSSIMYISELVIAFCFQTVNWGTIGTYRKLFSTKSPSTVEEFGVHSNQTGSLMVESRLGLVELVVDLYSPLCTFLNEPAICNGSSTAKSIIKRMNKALSRVEDCHYLLQTLKDSGISRGSHELSERLQNFLRRSTRKSRLESIRRFNL